MTAALFDTQHVMDIAETIRAKDGNADKMTVEQMPARIGALLAPDERECWVEKPMIANTPGITVEGHWEHGYTFESRGFGFDNYMLIKVSAGSVTILQIQLLPYSRRFQIRLGKEALRNITLTDVEGGDAVYMGAPYIVRANKDGISVQHLKSTEPFVIESAFSAPTNTLAKEIQFFGGASDTGKFGIFEYIKFYDADMNLVAHYSFVVNNAWQLFMIEQISGQRWPLPAGYKALVSVDAAEQEAGA